MKKTKKMVELEALDHTSTYEKHALGRGLTKVHLLFNLQKHYAHYYTFVYIKYPKNNFFPDFKIQFTS